MTPYFRLVEPPQAVAVYPQKPSNGVSTGNCFPLVPRFHKTTARCNTDASNRKRAVLSTSVFNLGRRLRMSQQPFQISYKNFHATLGQEWTTAESLLLRNMILGASRKRGRVRSVDFNFHRACFAAKFVSLSRSVNTHLQPPCASLACEGVVVTPIAHIQPSIGFLFRREAYPRATPRGLPYLCWRNAARDEFCEA